jgi:hypothetical protein
LIIEEDTYLVPGNVTPPIEQVLQKDHYLRAFTALPAEDQLRYLMFVDTFANAITQGIERWGYRSTSGRWENGTNYSSSKDSIWSAPICLGSRRVFQQVMPHHSPYGGSMAKYFSVEEANELVQIIRPLMIQLLELRQSIQEKQSASLAAVEKASGNGGNKAASKIALEFVTMESLVQAIQGTGAILKDLNNGLVDFLSLREGR